MTLYKHSDRIVAITGPRYFPGTKTVYIPSPQVISSFFNLLHSLSTKLVAHGDAIGWDRYISHLCSLHSIPTLSYPPDVTIDGHWPFAGHNRNRRMLESCGCGSLIVSPDGGSGTKGCERIGRKMKLKVYNWSDDGFY